MLFPIYSGADINNLPATRNNKTSSEDKLYAVNRTEIETFSIKILNQELGFWRDSQFLFVTAKVTKGILWEEFLNKHNLLIDLKNKQLIDGETKLCAKGKFLQLFLSMLAISGQLDECP